MAGSSTGGSSTADFSTGGGLTEVSRDDLEILAQALASGRIDRLSPTCLQTLALGHLGPAFRAFENLDSAAASLLLDAVLAERRRRGSEVQLVWTGPEEGLRPARRTVTVLRDLFREARRFVVVGGYSFDHAEDLFRPLHEGMARHGVETHFFVDVQLDKGVADSEQKAAEQVRRFRHESWPFGPPYPSFYYDARVHEAAFTSQHAKCVVVDDRWALVGSANFTDRGMRRNVEVGARIDDRAFAETLREQWMSLAKSGRMIRVD